MVTGTPDEFVSRIEIDPRRCGGTPVVKGTRIPVATILDQLTSGEAWESLLAGYPELTRDDIQAVLLYAKASIERTELIPAVRASTEHEAVPRSDVPG